MMRLLHCADVHLDAAFAGLGPSSAKRRRAAIRQSFSRIVDLALELQVDALTIGGDLFEDQRVTRDTAEFLYQQLARLQVPCLIAPGNHDYWHPGSLYASQEWPEGVHIFRSSQFTPVEVQGHLIFGAAHLQPKGTKDLLRGLRVTASSPAMALFHGSERGQLPFQEEGKQDHAPFSEEELAKAGFKYSLLGHFHTPRITQRLVYPGNPEPLTFGEEGLRGAALVELEGSVPKVTIHKVSTFQLGELVVDVFGITHSEALVQRILESLPQGNNCCTRVRLQGEVSAGVHIGPSELLSRLRADEDRCLDLLFDWRPELDLDSLRLSQDVRGQFVRALLARDDSQSELVQQALRAGLDALRGEEPAIL